MKNEKITRRTFVKRAAITGLAVSLASQFGREPFAQAAPRPTPIHGTCFDGRDCKNTYIDLGPVNKNGKHIVWVFGSPDPNPLDTGGNYSPNRLQNNVGSLVVSVETTRCSGIHNYRKR
jgi:hypothetical protein